MSPYRTKCQHRYRYFLSDNCMFCGVDRRPITDRDRVEAALAGTVAGLFCVLVVWALGSFLSVAFSYLFN